MNKVLAVIMVSVMLGACSASSALEEGDTAPDFTLRDMNGATAGLSDYAGKVILIDFFASWCPPCRVAVPDMIELQDRFGKQGFTVIGMSLEGPADTKRFAEMMGINYPVLIDDGKASGDYGPVRSIPTIFLIGKDLKVVKRAVGYGAGEKEALIAEIEKLLK